MSAPPFSFIQLILSADFYPDPCETEKPLSKTILLGPQTFLVQETYHVVFSTHASGLAPWMGYWVIQMFCFCFHRRSFLLSLYFYSILLFSQIFSATLSMTWCHTDQWLFNFRPFIWDLAVSEFIQPSDIRLHPPDVPITRGWGKNHHQGQGQVTYLLISRRRLMMSRLNTYSIADIT